MTDTWRVFTTPWDINFPQTGPYDRTINWNEILLLGTTSGPTPITAITNWVTSKHIRDFTTTSHRQTFVIHPGNDRGYPPAFIAWIERAS